MNPSNILRRLAKGPRWLLRRAGLDIVRYRGEGGSRQHLWNVQHSLSDQLARITDDTITAGPFKGARLSVSSRVRGSQLLGFYEQELHPFIEAVIEWKPDVVVNVGCAEGYYAIGMAKRIPGAKSFAYDLDPLAQVACKTARDINHIDLVVLGLCTDAELRERTEKAERPLCLSIARGASANCSSPMNTVTRMRASLWNRRQVFSDTLDPDNKTGWQKPLQPSDYRQLG